MLNMWWPLTGAAERKRESEHVKHISPAETCWHKRKLQKLYPTFLYACYRSPAQTGNEACWRYNRHYCVTDEHSCWEGETHTHTQHPHHETPPTTHTYTQTSWFHQHNCHGILITCCRAWWNQLEQRRNSFVTVTFSFSCSFTAVHPLKISVVWHSVRQQHSFTPPGLNLKVRERQKGFMH